MFRRQQTKTGIVDFIQLEPFEFHTRYTLHKLLTVQVDTSYDDKTHTLRAVISYEGLPSFGKSRVDGYKLSTIVLFPDLKKKTVNTVVNKSAILKLEGKRSPFDVAVSVPNGSTTLHITSRWSGGYLRYQYCCYLS